MKIQSTQSRSQAQLRARCHTESAEAPQPEPQDRVTLADRARSGITFGLTGSAVCGGGFMVFAAIERAFGFRAGLAEMALPLALSMAGGGALGASLGATLGE